jgi:hypothetical protein
VQSASAKQFKMGTNMESHGDTSQNQCSDCLHWQQRGGIVFPREWECTSLEGESTARMVLVVTAMAQLLARAGQCPTFSNLHVHQDGYLSQDLHETDLQPMLDRCLPAMTPN